MALPKLEGLVVVPTGGWAIAADEGGGDETATVAAGNYYLTSTTSLLSALKTALDGTTLTGVFTVTLDDTDDTSLGKVTISSTVAFTAVWTSTDLMEALGFTGDLTPSATSFTGASQARYLYLPTCGRSNPMAADGDAGAEMSDLTTAVSPTGKVVSLGYSRRFVDNLEFQMLKGSSTWITHETTTNASLQKFYRDVIANGRPVRYHKARETDATYTEWVVTNPDFKPTPVVPNWDSASALYFYQTEVLKNA